jgi:hypothetical protein
MARRKEGAALLSSKSSQAEFRNSPEINILANAIHGIKNLPRIERCIEKKRKNLAGNP